MTLVAFVIRHALLVLLVITPSLALAQSASAPSAPSQRPFRALFGGSDTNPNAHSRVDAQLFIGGGYDDNVAESLGVPTPGLALEAPYGALGGAVSYQHRGQHFDIELDGAGMFRYLETEKQIEASSADFAIRFNAQPGRRTAIGLSADVNYSPQFEFGLTPALDPVLPLDLGGSDLSRSAIRLPTMTYTSAITLTRELDARSTLGLDYNIRFLEVSRTAELTTNRQFVAHRAGIHYQRRMTPNVALRLGYAFAISPINLLTTEDVGSNHDIDVGLDYARELPLSRGTTLAMGFGSSVAVRNDSSLPLASDEPATQSIYALLGRARLEHRFGDDWSAVASYDRSVHYVPAFTDMLFADTVETSFGGYLSRRVSVVSSFSYLSGSVGFGGRNEVSTMTGGAGLRVAVNRYLALDTQYDYYRYTFGADVRVFEDINRDMSRNSVRAGLTVWLPVARF